MAATSSNTSTGTEHTEPNVFLYLEYNDVLANAELDVVPGELHGGRRAFNAATEHFRIGPCILHWSHASNIELSVLCRLDHEIQSRIRMPVSFEKIAANDGIMRERETWPNCVEAIARCVAAFQKATDATEHSQCDVIVAKLRGYATTLAQMIAPYRRPRLLLLLYEYIQNRTYDLAMNNLVNRVFEETGDGFWYWVGAGRQRRECLNLLEICTTAVTDHGQALRHKLVSLQVTEQTKRQRVR